MVNTLSRPAEPESDLAQLDACRQIIGQHHAHLIPQGLPGAGNLMVFDNGGSSGYGFANPLAPDGVGAFARATSRVLDVALADGFSTIEEARFAQDVRFVDGRMTARSAVWFPGS